MTVQNATKQVTQYMQDKGFFVSYRTPEYVGIHEGEFVFLAPRNGNGAFHGSLFFFMVARSGAVRMSKGISEFLKINNALKIVV